MLAHKYQRIHCFTMLCKNMENGQYSASIFLLLHINETETKNTHKNIHAVNISL